MYNVDPWCNVNLTPNLALSFDFSLNVESQPIKEYKNAPVTVFIDKFKFLPVWDDSGTRTGIC